MVQILEKVTINNLFIIADSARVGVPDDIFKCREALDIATSLSNKTQIHVNKAEFNMGCGRRVHSGLNWVFEITDRSIILEDDCIPDLSFFPFAEELLAKYEKDERISSIGGSNPFHIQCRKSSYYFSKYSRIWGWATWARSWCNYDFEMEAWSNRSKNMDINGRFDDPYERNYYINLWDSLVGGNIDTWDIQWNFYNFIHDKLTIVPSRNMINNIGHGHEGTHTKRSLPVRFRMKTFPMKFPLSHPREIDVNKSMDYFTHRIWHNPILSQISRILNKIRNY